MSPSHLLPIGLPLPLCRSRHARVGARALAYFVVAAVPLTAAVLMHDRAEVAARRASHESELASRVELAGHVVTRSLDDAASDLRRLASAPAVGEYLRQPSPVTRAGVSRDLLAFLGRNPWCRRAAVVPERGVPLTVTREAEPSPCGVPPAGPGTRDSLALATGRDGPRLCLSVPGEEGGRAASVVADADPRLLFAELAATLPAHEGPYLSAGDGEWLLPPVGSGGALERRPVAVTSWTGPASGEWLLAYAPDHRSGAADVSRRRNLALLVLLLAASGAAALALARAAEGRRAAERQSRRQLALLQLVSDNVPSPIFLKGEQGRYLLCNHAFERLVGRPREAILGSDVDALLPAGEAGRHRAIDRELLDGAPPRQYECRMGTGPDGPRDLLVAKAGVRDEDGAIVGVTAALVDITEIRVAEREQRRTLDALVAAKESAEAGTRAKSEFLAIMSHEMRTPLNAVLGATGLLLDGPLSHEQREQAGMVRSAGRALLDLIDDILDFSRVEAGRVELECAAFDPGWLARDTAALLRGPARDKGLSLSCDVAADVPPRLLGDAGRLRQILLNLLSNAVKFTERGGVGVSLDVARREPGFVRLRLRVRDTGPGIPPEMVPRLFEPFTQGETSTRRRHGGAGLGLAIAARLAALMDGTIEVDGAPGGGAELRCTVRLGCVEPGDDGSEPEDGPAPPVASERPRRHVLLAEDNLTNQKVTRAQLERLGCSVDVAGDGREAVRAAAERSYDVVFMDCHMPGLDGFEATREIRRSEGPGSRVPIVALTASALRGDRERCLAAGMSDYLAKPAGLAALAAVLERHAAVAAGAPSPAPAPPRASRVVDAAALASLRAIEDGDPGFLTILVREFDQGFRERLVDMRSALREGDPAALRGAAHGLKGSAGIVGATAMAELCRHLEGLVDASQLDRAEEALARLEREHEALMPALREAAVVP